MVPRPAVLNRLCVQRELTLAIADLGLDMHGDDKIFENLAGLRRAGILS